MQESSIIILQTSILINKKNRHSFKFIHLFFERINQEHKWEGAEDSFVEYSKSSGAIFDIFVGIPTILLSFPVALNS